jgi:hypothetical protein
MGKPSFFGSLTPARVIGESEPPFNLKNFGSLTGFAPGVRAEL